MTVINMGGAYCSKEQAVSLTIKPLLYPEDRLLHVICPRLTSVTEWSSTKKLIRMR
jgi:hypothetical protein